MRRIVVSEFVSIDGVMEGPGPQDPYEHAGWTMAYHDPAQMKYKLDETMDAEALLLGRVTYDGFAAAWPQMQDPVGFADKMNSMPKYVVSTTLTDPSWNNTTVIPGNVTERIAELKAAGGGDLLVAGSSVLIGTLLQHELVDELRLMTFPVVLGSGKRLFGAGSASAPAKFELAAVDRYDSGVVTLTYVK
ncbi:MAG: dihydrofolate reductase family protein [Solirubrobacteraceae bacterium]